MKEKYKQLNETIKPDNYSIEYYIKKQTYYNNNIELINISDIYKHHSIQYDVKKYDYSFEHSLVSFFSEKLRHVSNEFIVYELCNNSIDMDSDEPWKLNILKYNITKNNDNHCGMNFRNREFTIGVTIKVNIIDEIIIKDGCQILKNII